MFSSLQPGAFDDRTLRLLVTFCEVALLLAGLACVIFCLTRKSWAMRAAGVVAVVVEAALVYLIFF